MPKQATLTGRKIQELQRMPIRIPELERFHRAILRRKRLRPANRYRSEADLLQNAERPIHVADDDCEVLKPQILATAIGGLLPASITELNELDILRSQTHRECLEGRTFDAQ